MHHDRNRGDTKMRLKYSLCLIILSTFFITAGCSIKTTKQQPLNTISDDTGYVLDTANQLADQEAATSTPIDDAHNVISPLEDHADEAKDNTETVEQVELTIEEHQYEKRYQLPEGFVYLDEVVPHAEYDIRYFTSDNFVGEQVDGYNAPFAIGTKELATALAAVSEALYEKGYRLLIYDTYRPAKAVSYFKAWSQNEDTRMKEYYYPNEDKDELFKNGYLASRSGHSRGSTVDLTLLYNDTSEPVDMGSTYDMLDHISSFTTDLISPEQAENRELLKETMVKHGFKPYSKEWWHYVLKEEPFQNTYFDFDVE